MSFESLSEEELVQAARNAAPGDVRAFEQLVRLHHKRILANCRFLTRDQTNFEDLAQEVFVKAYFGLKGFEGQSSFGHWLKRIKVNHCLNHLKQREGKVAIGMEDESLESDTRLHVEPVAIESIHAKDTRSKIERVLGMLPLTLRVPLVMRDMDEFSYDEVAKSLGIGLSAAKMRIKRAREEFRRLYDSTGSGTKGVQADG